MDSASAKRKRFYMSMPSEDFYGDRKSQQAHEKVLPERRQSIVEESNSTFYEDRDESNLPPVDGKYAWLVACGSFAISLPLGLANSWGKQNCYELENSQKKINGRERSKGVMQDYYTRQGIFPGPSSSVQLTFVGTLYQAIFNSFMFFTNITYSAIGVKRVLIFGTVMVTCGVISAGEATSVWHLYLSLGFCTGVGASVMQMISIRVLPFWFEKYRSTACGFQISVVAFGGMVYPHLMVAINNSLGPSWTFRILGIVFFVVNVCAYAVIRDRKQDDNTPQRKAFDFRVLKNVNLVIWTILGPIQLFAQYITYSFLPMYASYIGLSDVQGATIVSIVSAACIIGRLSAGFVADKCGNLNTFIVCMAISALSASVIWVFATSFNSLIAFALITGLVSGCFGVVANPVTLAIVGPKDYAAASGIRPLAFITTIFGPLLAGYLNSLGNTQPFLSCKLVSGAGFATAGLLALILKLRMDKRLFAKV